MIINPQIINRIVKRNHSSFENVFLVNQYDDIYKILAWDDFVFLYNIHNGNIVEVSKETLRTEYKVKKSKEQKQ